MSGAKKAPRKLITFVAAGLELAGLAVVFAAFGYGIDQWLGNTRLIGTGITGLVGFTLGMVRFVLLANQANAMRKPRDHAG